MKDKKNQTLEDRCRTLEQQRRRLREQIKELTAERDQYKKSLIALMHEDMPVNKKEMLALARTQPSIWQLIDELKAQGA
jgi:uncharacterized coiled-coil DUF342 family protein